MDNPVIVVGVDGSVNSDAALDWSIIEAHHRGAQLVLAHVRQPGRLGLVGVRPQDQAYPLDRAERLGSGVAPDTEPSEDDEHVLDRAVQRAEGRGVQVTGRSLEGHPADLLVEESRHAELLVVGSRGLGLLGRAALGSVSTRCVHHAHCPVVVVPPPNAAAAPSSPEHGT